MNLYHFSEVQILLFALVLLRMTAFVVSSAVLGSQNISVPIKILFSITLTIIVFPIVEKANINGAIAQNIISYAAREVMVGLFLGFLTRLFFFTISMVGELVSISMGLSSAQLFNPMMGNHGNIMEQFFSITGTLVFFAINGHHMLISGLCESFHAISPASLNLNLGTIGESINIIKELFILTIKMAAPILIAVLISNISMGIIGRAVPQINVLVTSMPITILLGLGITLICMPLFVNEMNGIIDMTSDYLIQVMKHL